jgi:hypothetical protein
MHTYRRVLGENTHTHAYTNTRERVNDRTTTTKGEREVYRRTEQARERRREERGLGKETKVGSSALDPKLGMASIGERRWQPGFL